jgi:phage terminase small subunit
MTPKQEQFVREYLIDLNATQAAVRAGYSAKTAEQQGSRLLSNVKVSMAVQAAMDARSERTAITSDYVLDGIRTVTERCASAGEEGNPQAALKGYELLGRHLKMFTDKVEHSGRVDLGSALDALDDDD